MSSNDNKYPQASHDDKDRARIDNLLQRMEQRLDDIETDEILKGYSIEELEQKGMFGQGTIHPHRSEYSPHRTHGFWFEKGIDYEIIETYTSPDEIPIEELDHLSMVEKGQRLAAKSLEDKHKNMSGLQVEDVVSQGYLDKCNCTIRVHNDTLIFTSALRGKAVVIEDALYVVGADNRDAHVNVTLSQDAMQAWVDLFPARGNGKTIQLQNVKDMLKAHGVVKGIDTGTIEKAITDMHTTKKPIRDVVVARGMEAIDGKDATVHYNFNSEPRREHFIVLPDGRVDYRGKAQICIVKTGDLLATVSPPKEGKDGYDVAGGVIKARIGEKEVLHEGDGVVEKEEEGFRYFFASDTGQVVLDTHIIHVYQQYTVEGDVDYASGNIDFPGHVMVQGSVLAGFEVKASGDIVVMKSIEGAHVHAGRDLIVAGGIVGTLNTHITCGRNCEVTYLQNAYIEAQGNITITNAAIQSETYCSGYLSCTQQKGALLGGIVHALRGIQAKTAGSEQGAKTRLVVGDDYLIRKKINELEEIISFFKKNIAKIDEILLPVIREWKRGAVQHKDKVKRVREIKYRREKMKKDIATLEWKKRALSRTQPSQINPEIHIKSIIYPDVMVKIRSHSKKIQHKREKVIFFFNHKTESIQSRTLT